MSAEQMIAIYHTAFIVCTVIAVLCFIISIVLFIKFNIPKIFDMKTGRGKQKDIRKIQEVNEKTGRLNPNMSETPSILEGNQRVTPPVESQNHVQKNNIPYKEEPATELLNSGIQETTLLQAASRPAALTQGNERRSSQQERKLPGGFKIEKEIMWVHTEEVL